MASLTHIRVSIAEKRRAHARPASAEHVSDEQVFPGGPAGAEGGPDWPSDLQVWGWAQSAVLSGYGPGPASLL